MSSKSYKINKWEGLVTPYSTKTQPIVYIEPDTSLLNYSHVNGNKFRIKITNSLSLYDDISMIGYFSKPKECCDDSIECNKLSYIFILDTEWKGLPLELGSIDVDLGSDYGFVDTSTSTSSPIMRMLPNSNSSSTSNNKHTWILWVIVALVITILLICFLLYKQDKNTVQLVEQQPTTLRQPTLQQPTTVQPTTLQQPTTVQSTTVQPTTLQQPTLQQPTLQQPTTVQSTTVRQPTVRQPTLQQPIVQQFEGNVERFFGKTGLSDELLKNRLTERGKN